MADFVHAHLGLIYQLQGLAFVVLGVVAFMLPARGGALYLARHLKFLGAFGLLHGLAVLVAWESMQRPAEWLDWLYVVVLPLSYLPLLEFGRRTLNHVPLGLRVPAWPVYLFLSAFAAWIIFLSADPQSGVIAAARAALGLPAALLTAAALWAVSVAPPERTPVRPHVPWLRLGALAFAFYGLLIPVLSAPVAGLPVWWPTEAHVLEWTGLPVRLGRAVATVTVAVCLIALVRKVGVSASEDLHRLLGTISGYIYRCDNKPHWPATFIAGNIEELTGVPAHEFLEGKNIVLDDIVHPDDKQHVWDEVQAAVAQRRDYEIEYRFAFSGDRMRWFFDHGRGVFDRAGRLRFVEGHTVDVTPLREAVEDLREAEKQQRNLRELAQREQGRMSALLSGMSIGILFEDRDSRVEYVNPAFRRMWAIDEKTPLVGRPTTEVLDRSTHRFARPDHASKYVLRVLDTHEISERFELDLYDGRVLTQLSYPVFDPDGRLIGRLWIYEDVTHERQTAQQLVYLAEHDPLTGLHNRHRFQEHLERMIKTAERMHGRFALMYFDLDDFKHINDNFGHSSGDTVLVRTAGEVSCVVRSGEMFARLGGDEFAILTELSHEAEPGQLAERVIHAISSIPLRFRGSNLRLTASVGIAIYPTHGRTAEDLVARADTAMYQAKNQGKNTWAIYDAQRSDASAMLERMSWSSRIANALQQDALELHYQGVYQAADGALSHLEVLVRMRDVNDSERLLMPGQFIPVAEKTGQILELDRWVLRRAVQILAQHAHLSALAVNVSGRSIDQPALPQYIQQLLEAHKVAPERLIVELTETAAVSEMQHAQRFIERLQQLGCMVCLDDFGSGFSTFSYLKYLAVKVLKIDGMFIRDLSNNPDNQAFVRAMIDVAQGLGKRTVAEFVEDADTLDMLRELGVDLVQGFYLDRPAADHPGLRGH